jgi:hypothetical protein
VSSPARHRFQTAACWLLALTLAAILLALTSFTTRDADSRVYITIASKLASEPLSRWIAPQWWGAWGMQGLFREHPIGTFVLPALLGRAGYPPGQASFVITLAAQVASLLMLVALASRLMPPPAARSLAWTLQLLPIAFVFRIRANQEYLLLAGVLLAVVGINRARRSPAWLAVALAGFVYALLVKGVFAFLAPVCCALWLLTTPSKPEERRNGAWAGIVLMVAFTPLIAWEYERLYLAATGQSFLAYYLGPRIALDGSAAGSALPFPLDKAWNALWYLGRVAWYAAPWSPLLAAAWWIRSDEGRETRGGGRATMDGGRGMIDEEKRGDVRWIRYCALATLSTVLLVALRDTKADRYVFPAYFFAAAAGTILAVSRWKRAEQWALALDRSWPWGPVALWGVLFLSRLVLR